MAETRLEAVRRILNAATDHGSPGDPFHEGKRRFWNLSRDEFVATVVYGQQVIVVGQPDASALVKSLKGIAPFDGSQFPKMPIGRPPVSDLDSAFIEQWIRDGAPDSDAIARDTRK